jgi:hypothetical protein
MVARDLIDYALVSPYEGEFHEPMKQFVAEIADFLGRLPSLA